MGKLERETRAHVIEMQLASLDRVLAVREQCLADDIDVTEDMATWTEAEAITFFESGGTLRPSEDEIATRNPPPAAAASIENATPKSSAAPCVDIALQNFLREVGMSHLSAVLASTSLEQCVHNLRQGRLHILGHLKEMGVAKLPNRQALTNALGKAQREGRLEEPFTAWMQPQKEDDALPSATSHVCDKCDGAHATADCPWFKKDREDHVDSKAPRKLLDSSRCTPELVYSARIIRQPGDGSCLFHSLAHGLRDGTSASMLRKQLVQFISTNEVLLVCEPPRVLLANYYRLVANY